MLQTPVQDQIRSLGILVPKFSGFSFAEVEEILASLNRIAPGKRAAFRARLKHLQVLGFPPGANTGTGRRATYTFKMLLQMCLATELAQTGMSPKRAVQTIQGAWRDLEHTFLLALLPDDMSLVEDNRFTWVVSPEALRDLSSEGETDTDYRWLDTVVPLSRLVDSLDADRAPFMDDVDRRPVGEIYRHIVIQIKPLLTIVLALVQKLRPDIDLADLGDEFENEFASELAEAEREAESIARLEAVVQRDPEALEKLIKDLQAEGGDDRNS